MKGSKLEATTKRVERIEVYPIVPSSKQLSKTLDGQRFKMFGVGNEKRDLVLLVRGDLKVVSGADTSFFGCLNCGYIGHHVMCSCHSPEIYFIDGAWKGSVAQLSIGERDREVTIMKM